MCGMFTRKNKTEGDCICKNKIDVLYDKFEKQMLLLEKKISSKNIIEGIVFQGTKNMKTIGFPTINVYINTNIDSGFYISTVDIDGEQYNGLSLVLNNIIEMNIFDFDKNIYGKQVVIKILKKIEKFDLNIKNNNDCFDILRDKFITNSKIAGNFFLKTDKII